MVTRPLPCWPAIFMPLNTRAGVAHAPIEPGERCFLWLPCDAPWPLKLWRCIAPVKPLPLLIAGDVDPLAGGEHVGAEHLADLEAATGRRRAARRGACAGAASAFFR